jgi:hypothetical protein
MSAFHRSGRPPLRMANGRSDNDDAFLDADVGYPDRRSQYRGHQAIIVLMLLAGVAALVLGLSEGTQDIAGAFPTAASLLEGASWAKLFAGLGTLATVGLIVVAVALFWRWRIKRARRR